MTKRKSKPAPMVSVRWTDASFSTDPHWCDGQQPEPPRRKSHNVCVTVGWLVHLDDDWVQLVATLTDGQHAHVTEIPRGMVSEIAVLEPVGKIGAE